jgi:hypothetical protein
VNDTAWEAISIARQCAKEDVAVLDSDIFFAYLCFKNQNTERKDFSANYIIFGKLIRPS